jgi:hypothetical protein
MWIDLNGNCNKMYRSNVLGKVMNYESLKEAGISRRETRTSRGETLDPSYLLLVSYFTVARTHSLALDLGTEKTYIYILHKFLKRYIDISQLHFTLLQRRFLLRSMDAFAAKADYLVSSNIFFFSCGQASVGFGPFILTSASR